MKIRKSQIRRLIKEAILEEMTSLAYEQKQLSEYMDMYLEETPFLKEHSKIKTKKALLEFFGPFKKLGVKDLDSMGKDKETKVGKETSERSRKDVARLAKEVESARKTLSTAKLTNVAAMEVGLEVYVEKLIDLYKAMQSEEIDDKLRAQASKPFAAAAYTLQNLSASLAGAANELFGAVPKSSGVYATGQETSDIEAQQKTFIRGPVQQAKQTAKDIWGMAGKGFGSGRGRPR